jgi:hypothetical protein
MTDWLISLAAWTTDWLTDVTSCPACLNDWLTDLYHKFPCLSEWLADWFYQKLPCLPEWLADNIVLGWKLKPLNKMFFIFLYSSPSQLYLDKSLLRFHICLLNAVPLCVSFRSVLKSKFFGLRYFTLFCGVLNHLFSEIWGSHGGENVDIGLLCCM